jgi:hypothetical protein
MGKIETLISIVFSFVIFGSCTKQKPTINKEYIKGNEKIRSADSTKLKNQISDIYDL